jgi:hypothetical protein
LAARLWFCRGNRRRGFLRAGASPNAYFRVGGDPIRTRSLKIQGVDIQQIISGFQGLSASDFDLNDDNSDGMERLYELANEVERLSAPESAIPEMFRLMERLPDADLGSPGPLVHTLEAIPGYEAYLIESVRRQPSLLSVWMVNRILNSASSGNRRHFWMALLEDSIERTDVPESVRKDALDFLKHQRAK